MVENCVFCCSSRVSFNPTSHLTVTSYNLLDIGRMQPPFLGLLLKVFIKLVWNEVKCIGLFFFVSQM